MQEKISFNETVFFDKIKIALQRLESDTDAKLRSLMTSEANSKTVTDFGDPIKKFKDIVKIYGINGATVSKKDFPDEIYAAVMQRVVAIEAPKFSGGSLNEGYIIKQLGAYISDLLDTKTETITVGNKNYTLSNPIGSTLSTITVTINDAHYVFSWNDDATARKSLNIFMKNLAEFEKEQLTSIFFAILKDAKKFTASSDGNSSDTLSKWLNALMHGRKTKSLSNLNGFEYFRQLSLVTKSTSVPGELISLVTDVFDTLKPALEVYGKLKSPNKQAKKLLETIESVRGTAESVKKFMSFTKDIFTDNGGTISSLIDKYDNLLEKTTTLAAYIDEHEISSAETLAASSAYKNFVKAFNNLESVAGVSTTSFAVVLDECKICEFSDVTTAEISQNRALINGNGDDNNILSKGTSVTLNGNAGDDTLMTSGGYACVNGGDGADSIISEGRYSEINGDAGNDFIQIKGNGSSVNGGTGTDTLLIDAANVTVDGGTNFDFLPVPDKIIVGSNAEDLLIKNFEYADTLDLSEYKIGDLSAGKYQTNSLEIWSRTTHKTIAILEDVTGGTDNNILCTGNDYLFTAVSLDWLLANTPTIATPYATLKPSSVVNIPINGTVNNTVDNVIVCAQSGNNSINNTGYAVIIDGGTGNDTIDNGVYYNGDFSTISGGEGSDLITNYIGRNVIISGGTDNDSIYNYSDSVSIDGGAGNDSIRNSYDVEHVTIDGGYGNDSIYNYEGSNVIISGGEGDDSIGNYYSNNVSIDCGNGNDTLINNANNTEINGGAGNNFISNKGLNILIFTGDGNNTIVNGNGDIFDDDGSNVLIKSGTGSDSISNSGQKVFIVSNDGNDTILNSAGTVSIDAGDGNDSIENGGYNVSINAGEGDDSINNWRGPNVTIDCGKGNDYIVNNASKNITITGGEDNDSIRNYSSFVSIDGGDGDDSIYNDGSYVTIDCGKGNDYIVNNGYISHDVYYTYSYLSSNVLFKYSSGDGNDKIYGFRADSTLSISGAAYSSVVSGNDLILTVGNGKITLYGAATLSSVHIDGTLTTSSANVGLTADSTVSNTIISGTSYADSIKNTGNKVTINANADNDTINNVGSSVRIDAGNGNDRVYNNSTGVFINGNEDDDYIENGYYGIASDTTIDGGTGNDTIWNGETKVSINGNDGNDSIYSYAPEVTIGGGAGDDTIWNDWGQVVLFKYAAGDGNDVLYSFGNDDKIKLTGTTKATPSISGKDVIITTDGGKITVKDAAQGKVVKIVNDKDSVLSAYTYYADRIVNGKSVTLTSTFKGTFDAKNFTNVDGSAVTNAIKITGGTSASTLTGGSGADTIAGGKANDKLFGNAGNDSLSGGDGADTLSGTAGNDKLLGGAGNDSLSGGDGNDTLLGDAGNDNLTGGKGKDTFVFSGGKDTITDYTAGDDNVSVASSLGKGKFSISGKNVVMIYGSNTLTITSGLDKKITFNGTTSTYKKSGIFNADSTAVTLPGATKTFDASAKTYSKVVTVDGSAVGSTIKITGNDKANVFTAGANGSTLTGGKGKDTLNGGAGNDSILGGADNDKLLGNAGNDILSGGDGNDTLSGGAGNDKLTGDKGNDSLVGGNGADTLTGSAGNDNLTGGKGKDTFVFSGGKDTITDYTVGDDNVSVASSLGKGKFSVSGKNVIMTYGSNTLTITNGLDKKITFNGMTSTYKKSGIFNADSTAVTLPGATKTFDASAKTYSKVVTVDGSAVSSTIKITGNDKANVLTAGANGSTLSGGKGNDSLNGGAGNDSILGGANNDKLFGNTGNDSLKGEDGADTLSGGSGNDKLYGDKGNDSLWGGAGNDTLYGGTGDDIFIYKPGEGTDTIFDYAAGDMLKILKKDGKEGGTFTKAKFASGDLTLTISGGGTIIFDNISKGDKFNINDKTYTLGASKLK